MPAVHKSTNVTHHTNKFKRKNHKCVSTDTEKAFDQNSTPIHDKNSQKTRNREDPSQLDKDNLQKILQLTSQLMVRNSKLS